MSYNNYGDGLDLEEEGLDEFAGAEIPTSLKGLRACKRCSLVKGNDQVCQCVCVGLCVLRAMHTRRFKRTVITISSLRCTFLSHRVLWKRNLRHYLYQLFCRPC